jgi:hypothetical protein
MQGRLLVTRGPSRARTPDPAEEDWSSFPRNRRRLARAGQTSPLRPGRGSLAGHGQAERPPCPWDTERTRRRSGLRRSEAAGSEALAVGDPTHSSASLRHSSCVNAVWTPLAEPSFTADCAFAHEPHFATNGISLTFTGKQASGNQDIWAVRYSDEGWEEDGLPCPPRGPGKLFCASVAGFSLHAAQCVPAHDREARRAPVPLRPAGSVLAGTSLAPARGQSRVQAASRLAACALRKTHPGSPRRSPCPRGNAPGADGHGPVRGSERGDGRRWAPGGRSTDFLWGRTSRRSSPYEQPRASIRLKEVGAPAQAGRADAGHRSTVITPR